MQRTGQCVDRSVQSEIAQCRRAYLVAHIYTGKVEGLLACSDSVVIISRWCEVAMQYEQGRVSHAVAGCMRSLLQDWHLMVTQLEHQLLTGHLTLQVSPYPRQAFPKAYALAADVTDVLIALAW